MLLNVTVPVLNEQGCLRANTRRLVAFLDDHVDCGYEIVIADNGSTDDTPAQAQQLAQEFDLVRVLRLERAGRGGALQAAWQSSTADIVSYMDADLSSDLRAFPSMVERLDLHQCDIAVGSRRLNPATTQRGWKRELTSRVYVALVKAMFSTGFGDPQCGFKALRREAAIKLLPMVEDRGWFFDTELLVLAERDGWRIQDVPVAWIERKDSRVRIVSTVLADLRGLLRLRRRLRALPVGQQPRTESRRVTGA